MVRAPARDMVFPLYVSPAGRAIRLPTTLPDERSITAFIGHAPEDLARVEELVRFIEDQGVACWYAARTVSG